MSDKIVMLNESSLTNIANAIRTKLSSTDSYRPSDMDEAIMSISNSGGVLKSKKYNIKITQSPNQTINVNYKVHTPTPPKPNSTIVSEEEICRYDYEVTATGNSGYLPGEITVMKNGIKSSTSGLLDGDLEVSISDAIENLTINLMRRYAEKIKLNSKDIAELTNPKLIAQSNTSNAFTKCGEATIPKIMINTSNVTSMKNMFSECRSLKSLDLSNFDTSKVTDMRKMFEDCENLEILDLSNFDTSGLISDPKLNGDGTLCVYSMNNMFKNAPLKYLILNNKEVKFNVYDIGLSRDTEQIGEGAGLNVNCMILVPKESLEKYRSCPTLEALSSQFDAIENYNITRSGDGSIQVTPIVPIDNSKRVWKYIRQVKIINKNLNPDGSDGVSIEYENIPVNYEGTIMVNDNFDKIKNHIKKYKVDKDGRYYNTMQWSFGAPNRNLKQDNCRDYREQEPTLYLDRVDDFLKKGYLMDALSNQVRYIDLVIEFSH